MAEVIYGDEEIPTGTITIRIDLVLKKEYLKARELAEHRRPRIKMGPMLNRAIADVVKSVLAAAGKGATVHTNGVTPTN